MPHSIHRPLPAAALLLFAAVACRQPSVPEEKAIRVGVVAPFDEDGSERVWRQFREGAELAAREINDRGGVAVGGRDRGEKHDGRRLRLELLFTDDGDNPDTTVEVGRQLIYGDRVAALIGPIMSRNALVLARVAENAGMPMITPTASHPEVTAGRRFVFRVTFTDDVLGRVLARLARDDLRASRAAALFDAASAYNRAVAEFFRQEFTARGGRMVAFEVYTTGESDFRAPLERIRAAAPEVLLLPNYVTEVSAQAAQARALGIAATLLGGDSWDDDRLIPLPEVAGSYLVAGWHREVASPRTRVFVDAFHDAYGHLPHSGAALTYDAVGLLCHAIESRGRGGEEIREGLGATADYPGVTGTITFRGRGDPAKSLVILRIEDGRTVIHREVGPDYLENGS